MSLQNNGKYKICISPKSAKRQGLRRGDVVRRQYFDGQNIIYSLMVVLETGIDRITTQEGDEQDSAYFIGALIDGDIPRSGQVLDFVRVTNLFDEARSGAMYLTASDSDSPYMDIIDGMARENSLCFPSDENNCRYTLDGKEFLSGEYFPYKDGCNRVFRIRRNGIPLTGSVGLNQILGTGLGNPEKVIVSYKIRASRELPSIPFSLGYADGSETDGNGIISVSTDWEYRLSLITIDYLPQYERSFKLDLSDLNANDWCEIAELNIIRLSDIATFADATKARVGKVQGIVDPTFGKLDGYGAYFQRLYATQDVNIAGTLTAGDESGFASTFYVGRIHKNCLINSLHGNFLHPVGKAADRQAPAGIGDVFRISIEGATIIAQTQNWAEAHQGERYCFSFWAKAESSGTVSVLQNGFRLQEIELDGQWRRYHVSWAVRYEEPDDLLIELTTEKELFFCSAQLEKGKCPTLYQATDSKLTDTEEYGAWFARGGIGGTIQNPLLKLNADGSISAGDGSFVIKKDGTGYFAGGRFKWTQDTIALQDVTIRWEDFDDEAKENLRAKYVTLTGTDIFHYANASQENSCEPKEIILSATEYNFAATVRKWQYLSADGDWKDIPGNNSGSFQLLPLSSIWEGRKVLTLKYIATLDGCDYFDTITISKQYDGAAGSEANMLDWVKDWNSSKTVIGSETLITPKLFAGTKNNNNTITGIAIGRFPLSTMNASGAVTIETINGIYGFKDGYKTFAIDTTGSVQLGNGNQFIRYNATTGKVEFGSDVSLNWMDAIGTAKAEAIDSAAVTAQAKADAAKNAAVSAAEANAAGQITSIEIGGDNYLPNGDFRYYSTNNSIGWDNSLNGTYTISNWGSGYNSGVVAPSTGYHAHLNTAKFGYPVLELINKNSVINQSKRWLGIAVGIYQKERLIPGAKYTFSADLQIDTTGACIHGGVYSCKKGQTGYGFSSGQYSLTARQTNKWERVSFVFTLDADVDLTKSLTFYIYGYNGAEGICYVKNVSLQQGTKGSWARCDDDISKDVADAKKAGTDAKTVADAITNKANSEGWATKLTYIDSTGIFTGTLSANIVNALQLNASQITAGTIDAARINVTALKTALITAGNIEALTLNVVRGKIGGWSIGADTIYHVLNEKYMILKSGEGDSPVGSGRGHRGFTIYNDDSQVSDGQVKVVQMGALANVGTANVWNSETNYGFRIALKGGKDVFRADNTGATIAGWKMDTDALYRGTKNNAAASYTAATGYLTIGSNGIRGFKWRLEADGSGAFAGGNISWNAAGNVTFASSVALAWSTPIAAITTALGGSSFPKMTHISGTGIYTGTITAGQVNAVAINASSITTGTLSADRIAANSIKAEKLDAASIKSQIINTAYINGLSCTFIRGSIGGWRMNDSYIIAMNPPEGHRVAMSNTGYLYNDDGAHPYWALKADGSALFAHEKVKFSYDGSGFVANGNISWDAAGKVSFSPAVSLNWTDAIGALEIGGNNLLNNSGNWRTAGWNNGYASNGGGYTIDTGVPFNGSPTVKTDVGSGLVHSWLTLENNIEYTYSAMVRCNKTITGNGATPLHYWAGKDNVNQSKISVIKADTSVTANVWKRIFIVFKLTGDANSFRPFFYRGGNESTYYNIAYFKLERGNKPTDWCQSDSDANKLSTDAQNSANSITTALGGGSFPKLTELSGTGIYTGTLTAEQINAVAINASSIKAGTLSADRIAANSIKADKLDANSIKSNLINVSYINGLTCTFNKGTIGGWRMNDAYIIAVNPPSGHRIAMSNTGYLYNDDGANDFWGLNADGSAVFAHGKAKFFNDGSGYIANGNISWDTAGKVSFSSSASLNWTNAIYEAKNANYGYQFHKDIIVKGDANTYYPVIIKGGDQTFKRDILIRRSYYEQAPVSWGQDSSHIGGLNLLLKTNFGGWGGITYSWNIYELEECYCRMFAGAAVCGNSCMFAIFLRGGGSTGAIYHLYSNQSLEGRVYSESPVSTEAPQIAYNSDLIFKSGSYTAYAPAPRTLTASVESEIRQHRYAASTYISSSGIYTGSISAGQINVDTALIVGGSSYNGSVSVRNASNSALVTLDRSGITAIAGRIGGWTLESGAIYASSPTNGHRVRLLSSGYLYNDDGSKDYWGLNADGSATFGYGKILFKNDGSGYVANNNIRWDASGNVTITGTVNANAGSIGGFTIGQGRIGSIATGSGSGGGLAIYDNLFRVGSSSSYVLFGDNTIPASAGGMSSTGRIVNNRYNSYNTNYGLYIDVKNGEKNFGIYSNAPCLANAFIGQKVTNVYFTGSSYSIDFSKNNIFFIYASQSYNVNLPPASSVAYMFGLSSLPSDFGYMFTLIYNYNWGNRLTMLNVRDQNGNLTNIPMERGDSLTLLCANYPSFHYQLVNYTS